MSLFYEFDDVSRFTTGAVGEPGQRTFYLQVQHDDTVLTLKCEKLQVATMAMHIRNLLKDLPEPSKKPSNTGFVIDPSFPDFTLGTIGLGYDRTGGRIFLQLDELYFNDEAEEGETGASRFDEDDLEIYDDEDEEFDADRIRMFITPEQAIAFCDAAESAVSGGREQCEWCGGPKDPRGHACPRFN